MKVAIGGDRLGTGAGMDVNMRTYNRSSHDLGYIWRSTMAPGTLVPFLCKVMLRGDTFDIDLDTMVMTHPTIGPLMGSYKVQLDVFEAPVRLYQSLLHNNELNIGMKMSQVTLPFIHMNAYNPINDFGGVIDIDNSQINPSSIFSYLGVRGLGIAPFDQETVARDFNGVPWLAYWDIYKNYYANKQEEKGYVIHTDLNKILNVQVSSITRWNSIGQQVEEDEFPKIDAVEGEGWDWSPNIVRQQLLFYFSQGGASPAGLRLITNQGRIPLDRYGEIELVDEFSLYVNAFLNSKNQEITVYGYDYVNPSEGGGVGQPQITTFDLTEIDQMRRDILRTEIGININKDTRAPYGLALKNVENIYSKTFTQEGLGLKTYLSDLHNNWISTEWIDGDNGISAITAVSTTDGSFTIDTLNLATKVYQLMNRIAISGGSYHDWLDAAYETSGLRMAQTPIYHGGLSRELIFDEVFSTSESGSGQPLGTLAGKGTMSGKKKGGKIIIKPTEISYVIGIVSLTPRLDYSQGNSWDVNLRTMDDFHKPALDEIGFQDLVTDQLAWFGTKSNNGSTQFRSAGKQPAWINYMTSVNEVRGNFAIADNEMFMTLNRRYEAYTKQGTQGLEMDIKDVTTYIDPVKYNYVFAETALDAQNFWVQIKLDITARRLMSAKTIPNL